MKALTISQPFASLIASGEKWIENRSWATNYRGWLAIHAGKGTQYLTPAELRAYPAGRIIAVAKLSACVRLNRSLGATDLAIPGSSRTVAQAVSHAHCEGPWCWILDDVRRVEHVPWRGSQGLWDVPEEIAKRLLGE